MGRMTFVTPEIESRIDSEVGAGVGAFFNRQLEQVEQQALRWKRPALNGMALFALKTDIDPGAETYTRRIYEHTGQAKMIGSYSSDLPRVDVAGTEESVRMRDLGDAFGYSVADLRAAQFASTRAANAASSIFLPTEKAMAARTAIDNLHNDVIWRGSPAHNLYGVLNHPYVPRYHIGGASTAAVDTVSGQIAAVFNQVANNTTEVERPNRILVAAKLYNYLGSRFRTNTDTTVLEMVAKSCGIPVTSIIPVHELNAAGDGGGDLVMADRKDPLVMAYVVPVIFQQEPVERKGLEYVVNCLGRSGGMMGTYPMGICIGEFSNAIA